MIVISRFHVPEGSAEDFGDRARRALAVFAACPGYVRGRLGRAADDPARWAVVTEWESVGAYRRSLSQYEVKLHASPLLATSVDEPSAYEVLVAVDKGAEPVDIPSSRAVDASRTMRVGEAAGPGAEAAGPGAQQASPDAPRDAAVPQ